MTMKCCKDADSSVVVVDTKVIAVIGSTSEQGKGLVKAIIDDPKGGFVARALTNDQSKESAVAWKDAGVVVVMFDIDDASTHSAALQGAYGVFVVTNYSEHFSTPKEKAQAKSIASACKQAGVKHIIWSTLENSPDFFDALAENERPHKLDGYYVPHLNTKGECKEYFPPRVTTFLYTSFYIENMRSMGMVKDHTKDKAPLPVVSSADIGKCAYGVFKAGDQYKRSTV